MDYDAPWFNKTSWIFEHLHKLDLTSDELIVLLVLSYFIDQKVPISYDLLMDKCHLETEQIDSAIDTLSLKGYLRMDFSKGAVSFVIDGLFDQPSARGVALNQPVLAAFEEEFGRTLSSSEMERITQMAQLYGEREIIYALDEAAVYDKRSINYVENVLISWQNKGLTLKDLERGKR